MREYTRGVAGTWFEGPSRSDWSYALVSYVTLVSVSADRSRQQAEHERRAGASAVGDQIVAALEDPRFKWRTIKGVSRQLNISESEVAELLNSLIDKGIVFQSSVSFSDGSPLYTTRRHFRACSSFWERLGAAFRNRGD